MKNSRAALLVFLSCFAACSSPEYDEEALLGILERLRCFDSSALSDAEFEASCYGKSVIQTGYYLRYEKGLLELSEFPTGLPGLDDALDGRNKSFLVKSKAFDRSLPEGNEYPGLYSVSVSGVITGRSDDGKTIVSPSEDHPFDKAWHDLVQKDQLEEERREQQRVLDRLRQDDYEKEAAERYAAAVDEANQAYGDWVDQKKKELAAGARDVSVTHIAGTAVYTYDMLDGRIVLCRQYAGKMGIQFDCDGE